MLGVVGHARCIAVPPYRIDFVDVLQVPCLERAGRRIDARFLGHFPASRLLEGLPFVLAAGDRLPEARVVRALEQQHPELRGVDHHEGGDRDLVGAQTRARALTCESPENQPWGMSRVRCCATALPSRSTAMMPTSASNIVPISARTARTASARGSPRSTRSETARVESRRITYSPVPVAEAATWLEA